MQRDTLPWPLFWYSIGATRLQLPCRSLQVPELSELTEIIQHYTFELFRNSIKNVLYDICNVLRTNATFVCRYVKFVWGMRPFFSRVKSNLMKLTPSMTLKKVEFHLPKILNLFVDLVQSMLQHQPQSHQPPRPPTHQENLCQFSLSSLHFHFSLNSQLDHFQPQKWSQMVLLLRYFWIPIILKYMIKQNFYKEKHF